MKVLMVSPLFPYPLDSGTRVRVFGVLKALSQKHDVTFLGYYRSREELDQVGKLCRKVVGVPRDSIQRFQRSAAAPTRIGALLETFKGLRPSIISSWYSKAMENELTRLMADNYDVIWIVRLWVTGILTHPPANTVLDLDELESIKKFRSLKTFSWGPSKAQGYISAFKMSHAERSAAKQYGAVLVASERERRILRAENVFVLPNTVSLPESVGTSWDKENSDDLVFFGTMKYGPNVDAIKFFCTKIWPLIKKARPSARFWIVGPNPPQAVRQYHDGKTVMVTGYVEDLRSLLMACGVVVVPLRNGGGTRIKVLEAMAMSKAVVSTSVGCEGLDVVHGKHLLVADQPEEFSRHCLALMADRPGRIRLGQNARQLVEEKYRLEVLPDIVDRILDKVAPARLQKSVQLVGK